MLTGASTGPSLDGALAEGEGDQLPHALSVRPDLRDRHQRGQDPLRRHAPVDDAAGGALRLPGTGRLGGRGSGRRDSGRRHRADLFGRRLAHLLQSGQALICRTEPPPSGDAARACTTSTSRRPAVPPADSDLPPVGPHRLADHHGRPGEDRGRRGDQSRRRRPRLQRSQPLTESDRPQCGRIPGGRNWPRASSPSRSCRCSRAWATSPTPSSARSAPSRNSALRDVHRSAAGLRRRADRAGALTFACTCSLTVTPRR